MNNLKHKTKRPNYNHDYDQIIKDLDFNNPIKFPKKSNIIDNIHEKYPIISKTEIAIVINEIIYSLRELIFSGKTISIGFLKNFELHVRKNKDDTKTVKYRYLKEIKNGK